MTNPYDIEEAFAAIEEELIESMIRNMMRHKAEEDDEGIQWEMWQAKQLEALEKYKKANRKKFSKEFDYINQKMEELIKEANAQGMMEQELEILQAIKNGYRAKKAPDSMQAEFFKLNERKLEALINATTNDMQKAETAILRMADDKYRQIIYNAQVYANTGAGTYEKAVDMATKDMLTAGLNCVEYANGARYTLKDYADMAIRTASKRAYLQGEGVKRQEWGISTVIVNKRGNPCPKCLPFCGKILIDDVWSGGSKEGISEATGLKYPLMSSAVAAGLYHPRCKDVHTTYFEGISTPPDDKYTREELDQIAEKYRKEQKQQYAERQAKKFERLGKYSLDEDNKRLYQGRAKKWEEIVADSGSKGNLVSRKTALNKNGEEIIFNLEGVPENKKEAIFEAITSLSNEYDTCLREVQYTGKTSLGRESGAVDVTGSLMSLNRGNGTTLDTIYHEFTHSLDSSKRSKKAYNDSLDTNKDYWKEAKKLFNKYKKEAANNRDVRISEYSLVDVDEFMAEAFAASHGFEPADGFGVGGISPYVDEARQIIDKYFKKTAEYEFSPRKATGGNFGVNWEKINSRDYRKSLEKLSDNSKVVDAIEVRTKWALNNRDGLKTEELYAVSLDTGKEIASILGQQYEYGVKRTNSFTRKLTEADRAKEPILLIHNHPRGLPPSISDINILFSNKNASGITAGHDGSLYYYTRPKKMISKDDFDIAMKHFNKYTEVTATEKTLELLSKQYGFVFKKL